MIMLALGKKGSGKSALLRKLIYRAVMDRCPIFFHDSQAQLADSAGRVYLSVADWANDPHPPFLSIFRGVDPEDLAALALKVGNCTLCIDEMDQAFVNKRYRDPDGAIRKIIHEGRHYKVSLAGSFRRTANVPEDLMSQCDYIFLFRQSGSSPTDLMTIRQRLGDAYADAAQRLDTHQFTVWSDAA